MTRLTVVALLAVALVACTNRGERVGDSDIRYYHDAERGVSCWLLYTTYGAGISCLPDSQVQQP